MDNKKYKIIIGVLAILLVIALGVICFLLISNNKKEIAIKETKTIETETKESKIEELTTEKITTEPTTEEQTEKTQKYEGPFSIEYEAGIVYVEGYATVEKVTDEDEKEKKDYVFFHILKSDSDDFMKFIEEGQGNSYFRDKAIGLGCKSGKNIKYYNSFDGESEEEQENHEYKLDKKTTNKILKSTKKSPVKLKLERKENNSGMDAPLCYSHITHISLVE